MLGPLPKLYRVAVSLAAVAVFAAAGAWVALMSPYPVLLSAGAGVGLAVGAICAHLLLHDAGDSAAGRSTARQAVRRPASDRDHPRS